MAVEGFLNGEASPGGLARFTGKTVVNGGRSLGELEQFMHAVCGYGESEEPRRLPGSGLEKGICLRADGRLDNGGVSALLCREDSTRLADSDGIAS